jgi:hypothetical protein
LTATVLLAAGFKAVEEQPAAFLQQLKAVVSLASAVASTVKVWSLHVQGKVADEGEHVGGSNKHMLAALPRVLMELQLLVAAVAKHAEMLTDSSSSSSSVAGGSRFKEQQQQQQQQEMASCMLISVLIARSVVILVDALETAAAAAGVPASEHLAAAVFARPEFVVPAACAKSACMCVTYNRSVDGLVDVGARQGCQRSIWAAEILWGISWSTWMRRLLQPGLSQLMRAKRAKDDAIREFARTSSGTFAGQTAAAAAAAAASGCRGDASSSSAGRVRWVYLLPEQLLRSKKLAAAIDEFEADTLELNQANQDKCASASDAAIDHQEVSRQESAKRRQKMQNSGLQLCRVLAGAAPLPQLCNNLCCSSLAAGGTEAAAAVKVCSGCGAWYCTASCAAAHWRQHKKACRRMAALGLNVNA